MCWQLIVLLPEIREKLNVCVLEMLRVNHLKLEKPDIFTQNPPDDTADTPSCKYQSWY